MLTNGIIPTKHGRTALLSATFIVCAVLSTPAFALESSTVGSQTNQANVNVLNVKIDALAAQIQSALNCTAQRKFYAPTDPKKDANNCVGVGDYDLNMSSGSNVNFANGRVYATQSAANNWGGLFYGPSNYGGVYGSAGLYGLYGVATGNGYGVSGIATANSGGIGGDFSGGAYGARGNGGSFGVYGSSNNYGVYGYSPSSYAVYGASSSGYGLTGSSSSSIGVRGDGPGSWGGYFTGASGVYVANSSGYYSELANGGYGLLTNGVIYTSANVQTPTLCLNGDCRSAWPAHDWGGEYAYQSGNGYSALCDMTNPYTGGCSCPSGYAATGHETGTEVHWTFYHFICYR